MDRLSEEVRRLVVEAAFEAVVVLDGPTIVWCNQAMAELVGVPREDLIGRSGLDFATDDDRDRVVEAMGGHGEHVTDPSEIRPALERAFAAGKAA